MAVIPVSRANLIHVDGCARLRAALWPDETVEDHRLALLQHLEASPGRWIAFVALKDDGSVVGFAEAALRKDYVNGCATNPVAFLEGIYVEPAMRGAGVGRALADAVMEWGRQLGCREVASDADLNNRASHSFHTAIGFSETERVVYFRKQID